MMMTGLVTYSYHISYEHQKQYQCQPSGCCVIDRDVDWMICSDAFMACGTVTPSKQVYPIGHLARPQGLQGTGFANTRNGPSCKGPYLCGLLAPNIVTVGVPKAYAI